MFLINWAVFTLLMSVAIFASESGDHNDVNVLSCDDGQQILSVDKFCDGRKDCADGSDETAKNCIHMHCPSYAFRCTYGGCIPGTGKCDGKPDCADGSDESLYMCYVDGEELEKQLSGNCTDEFDFQCTTGKCISAYQRCDGTIDCADGSDELVSHCGHLYCPSYAFRCGYGACVRGSARCDGVHDCRDGSDETALLCRIPPPIPYEPIIPSSTEATTTTTTTTTRAPPRRTGCQIPFRVKKLQVTNLIGDSKYKLGDYVEANNTKVLFECKDNWQLVGNAVSTCTTEGTWTHPVPRCSKHCSNVLANKGISTDVKCFFYQNQVSCGNLLPTGASIIVTCAEGYEPKTKRSNKNQLLQCNEQVEWSNQKLKCTPTCGLGHSYDGDQSLGNRAPTRLKPQPWDVSVFMRTFEKTFKRQCSGAIISPKMIITAANCLKEVSDDDEWYGANNAYYNIVEGYHAKDYIQGTDIGTVMHNISRIIISSPEDVNGDPLRVHHDIALMVVVNYFQFNKMLSPICLSQQRRRDHISVTGEPDDDVSASDDEVIPILERRSSIAYPPLERPVELGDIQAKPRYFGSRAYFMQKLAVARDIRTGEMIFLDVAPFKKYFIKKNVNFYNVLL